MRTPLMNTRQFKAKAEAAFLRANPNATRAVFTWINAGPTVFRDGSKGFAGRFHVVADGYRPRAMSAVLDCDGLMVR
jgi:hypothetical protein